jgi:hypothetical protein
MHYATKRTPFVSRGLVIRQTRTPMRPYAFIYSRRIGVSVIAQNLVVMADEVYQTNVYADGQEFVSFREVLATMEDPTEVLLASLHSTSKGFYGECGLRGG